RGRTFGSKLFFFWKPQRTNPSENFQPRQEQPGHRCDQTPHPTVGSKIKFKKGGGENAHRPGFLRIRIVKRAETEAEHGHTERKKETEKHHETACLRIDLILAQKFLKLIRVKIGQNFVAGHKRGHVGLSRKLLHLLVCLAISADIDLLEAIAFLAEIILRINTPGAPLAAIEL